MKKKLRKNSYANESASKADTSMEDGNQRIGQKPFYIKTIQVFDENL